MEGGTVKMGVADAVAALGCRAFELVHDAAGEGYALDGTDALRIGSPGLDERLAYMLFTATGKAPGKASLSTAAISMQAVARLEGPEREVGLRVAGYEDGVVVDLGDEHRTVVLISADGWELCPDSPVPFYRPAGMAPLPVPQRGGSLRGLRESLALGDQDFVLTLGWVLGCFNPSGPKPLLELVGVQGSGKSMRARMLRALFDPCASPLQTMPGTLRNLAVLSSHRALLAFDNVSKITELLSDGLCRLSTGGGFDNRRLYTDDGLMTFTATRPVIVTGIPDAVRSSDLVDRTIRLVLPALGDGDRSTEAVVRRRFEAILPSTLGLLLDAVSCALRNYATTELREAPRMYDFTQWVEAGSEGLGWERDRFLDAYLASGKASSATVIDSSYPAQFVPILAAAGFNGTAAECVAELARVAGPDVSRNRAWPATAADWLSLLRRLAPAFADQGILVGFPALDRDGRQLVRITLAPDPAAPVAEVVPLARRGAISPEAEVVGALRVLGVDSTWPATKAAALAVQKAAGSFELAAAALNAIGVLAPSGDDWTADILRKVV
jgi:hypothetical protein